MRARAKRRGRRTSVSAESGASMDKDFTPRVIPKTDEQTRRIEEVVKSVFLFQALTREQLQKVVSSMEGREVSAGTDVITQGKEGDNFYVVETGEFDVFVEGANNGASVFHYKPGGSFGELALMYSAPRAATVRAVTDAKIWAVDRQTFRHFVVRSNMVRRQKYEQFLGQIPLFSKITDAERSQLADALQPAEFDRGNVIIQQGDDNYDEFKFYLLVQGEASVTITKNGQTAVVGELKEGDYFGEMALLEKKQRAATVTASSETVECAAMTLETFERLMGRKCRALSSAMCLRVP